MDKIKSRAIMAGLAALLLFVLIGVGLFLLGDSWQSALQKLRDIAIIFIVLAMVLNVILLAAITAAFGVVAFQLKDRIIPLIDDIRARVVPMIDDVRSRLTPLLDEVMDTVKRVHGTTNFITEEAVKPIISVAGTYSRLRTMTKTVSGKRKKPPKPPVYASAEQAARTTQDVGTVQSVDRVDPVDLAPSEESVAATQTVETEPVPRVTIQDHGST